MAGIHYCAFEHTGETSTSHQRGKVYRLASVVTPVTSSGLWTIKTVSEFSQESLCHACLAVNVDGTLHVLRGGSDRVNLGMAYEINTDAWCFTWIYGVL